MSSGDYLKCDECENLKHQLYLYSEANIILTRRITKVEEQLKRESELQGEKSVLIEQLKEALRKCNPSDDKRKILL